MHAKFQHPKLKQSEIADQLGYTGSTLKRYRNDVNMLSFYEIQSNIANKRAKKVSNEILDNNSHREDDLKRPQVTSNDLSKPQAIVEKTSNKRNKIILTAGSEHEKIKDKCLDEFLHKINYNGFSNGSYL